MTHDAYDLLLKVLELYKICFQSVILFSLWSMVFRTKKEKSAIIAAIIFVIMSIATGMPFTTPQVRYVVTIIFAMGYCLIRYRKQYEKAICVLLLYYNFHSLSALISISPYRQLQNITYQKLQKTVDQRLRNALPDEVERIKSDALYQLNHNAAIHAADRDKGIYYIVSDVGVPEIPKAKDLTLV